MKQEAQRGNAGSASPVMSEEHYSEVEISSEEEHASGREGRPSKRRRTTEAAKDLTDMVAGAPPWVFPAKSGFLLRHSTCCGRSASIQQGWMSLHIL